jgi:iron only hydrogenase large subunit-like protein/nitrogen-specific signal transduction histidine kinase
MQPKLVYTIEDLCRVCYTCVRECPVKAIQIINGQATVITERCIVCGNCTNVCSQGAKVFQKNIENVKSLLSSSDPNVVALLAPSFAAEFSDIDDYQKVVGMIRKLGFSKVFEAAFGADLVATKYRELYLKNNSSGYISSDCPSIVSFILKYHPDFAKCLVPIVSPMVAMARVVKMLMGERAKIVFIGPCISKKAENPIVDEALTFIELREMFEKENISSENITPAEFDPPVGGVGAIFPVSRGMYQTMDSLGKIPNDDILIAEGKPDFIDAMKEFQEGLLENNHLELLCCHGCTMGPGMSVKGNQFSKQNSVIRYVREKNKQFNIPEWKANLKKFSAIDLSASFVPFDQRLEEPSESEIIKALHDMGKLREMDQLNCGACGYETCRKHASAIIKGLAETEMCLPYTIDKLHNLVNQLAITNERLGTMQQALKQSEKLAHMGQLSAGIAHELNNPLGVVILYSNILLEECPADAQNRKDLQLIVQQAERCKTIVSGLLNFARKSQVNHSLVSIPELVENSLDSIIIPDNIQIRIENTLKDPCVELDPEQMIQVISNLVKNAVEAMPNGGSIVFTLKDNKDFVEIGIGDTGIGIQKEALDKVFEPFFTTKGIGKGTGLGLATAYGIVKMHKGKINVSSNADKSVGNTGTKFVIQLPRLEISKE